MGAPRTSGSEQARRAPSPKERWRAHVLRSLVGDAARPSGFAAAIALAAAATALGRLLGEAQLADVVMLYLLGVVLVSLRWGLVPAMFGAILSVASLDFFFVPPIHAFAVSDLRHLVTLFVMLVVAAVISGLNERIHDQADAARDRELRVETEQTRNALLSSVSHDLRTPLAVITGTASALLEDKLDRRLRRELTEGIVAEAERLNRLVRNLLDVTRLEAGAIELNKEWQPIEEAVGAALVRVDRLLGTRRIATDVPDDLPLVPYDALLLQQVLVNLLENAAKHTPLGSEIAISAREREGAVELVVADRGPGLPAGDEARVFEKFYRAEQGRGGGVGLGLTICTGIVAAHGGRIWAETRGGGGAAFHLVLPLEGEPPRFAEPPTRGGVSAR